jgi:glycine/D-amino acid oxidase-like deaminating enzyme
MGTACAYHPAHAGLNVTLVERRAIAAEASGGSTGGVRQQNRDPAELPLALAAIRTWKTPEQELRTDLEYRQRHAQRLIPSCSLCLDRSDADVCQGPEDRTARSLMHRGNQEQRTED